MTMLSRILGFVRDVVIAQTFGADAALDSFLIAFKLPNFLRRLFGEGAFSQAFVPVLAEFRSKQTDEATKDFVNRIFGTLGLIVMLVVAVVEVIAPVVVVIFAPGFANDPIRHELTTHMLHIMFPYLLLIVMTACSGAVLNTHNRFGVPAFTPVLLNVAIIIAAVFFTHFFHEPVYALAWGVIFGGVIQLALQLPFLAKIGLLPIPKIGFKHEGVRRVMKLMVPALFGVSVAQISLLVDNFFASFLPAGSISWLYYSDRLTYLPLGVIGVALATVVLPNLSHHHANKNHEVFCKTLDWALRMVLFIGLPAAVGLLFLAGPLISTLLQHGAFNAFDVIMTRKSLMAFSVGLPGFMLIKVLASGFYSQQNIKTPVKIAAVAMVLNLILNAALIIPLRHAGLALATSVAALLNASLLWQFLLRRGIYQPRPGWPIFMARLLVANVLMAIVLWFLSGHIISWMHADTTWRVLHLAGILAAAMITYVAMLFLTGMRIHHLKPPA
ncbi:MAG: murein biosynthesis integral membrane protein MurJ [Gammaproteobacteria bacterium]|nr:murein biosynthesis integral membrane protein MurJ [Gammaproteobacteria bacterium]MCH9743595.1 murein biosynthesis integral membrane protein MurJ [Gammaproteobacteria bacterium]